MRTRTRRFGALLTTLALFASVCAVLLPATAALAGTSTNTNACFSGATATYSDLSITMAGTGAPDPATLGVDTVTLSGTTVSVDVPADLLLAGYRLNLLNVGDNILPGTIAATIAASNSVEGSQNQSVATAVTATIVDPTPANRSSGDESALPISVSNLPLSDTTWTPAAGGTMAFSESDVYIAVQVAGGLVTADFQCQPGTSSVDGTTWTPAAATPFDTVSVVAPPAPPVAGDDNGVVGGGQSVTIDVLANDTDQNNDIDPSTVTVTQAPSGGTTSVNSTTGEITYANTDANVGTDTFKYTVSDLGGNGPSNEATVSVQVLGNFCTAPCSLDQVITVPIVGDVMTMEQAGQFVTLGGVADPGTGTCNPGPVVLNGQPQGACGALNDVTVVNARGTDDDWSLTGQVTDFTNAPGAGPCPATNPATWNNHCIPGDNLGWFPTAVVSHVVVPGDVATVTPGSSITPPATPGSGLGSAPRSLCSSPTNHSGGTFTCGAGLVLVVPASASAGSYTGTLTLTLA